MLNKREELGLDKGGGWSRDKTVIGIGKVNMEAGGASEMPIKVA